MDDAIIEKVAKAIAPQVFRGDPCFDRVDEIAKGFARDQARDAIDAYEKAWAERAHHMTAADVLRVSETRIHELEEALKPFAEAAPYGISLDSEDPIDVLISPIDLRRARDVLEGKK